MERGYCHCFYVLGCRGLDTASELELSLFRLEESERTNPSCTTVKLAKEKSTLLFFFRRKVLGSSVWLGGPKVSVQVSWAMLLLAVSLPPQMCAAPALLLSFSVVIFSSLGTVQALGSRFEPAVCSSSYPHCSFVTRTKCSLCIILTSTYFSN